MTERGQVQTGKDTILTRADKADPVDAVAELIWNGIDAEATAVDVQLAITELDDRFRRVFSGRRR